MARLNRYERKLYYKYNHPSHNSDGGSDAHRYESAASRNLNRVLNTKWRDDDFDLHYSNPRKGWGRGHTGYFNGWKHQATFLKGKVGKYVQNPLRKMRYKQYTYAPRQDDWELAYKNSPKLFPQNKKLWVRTLCAFIEMQYISWSLIQKLPEPELLKYPPCKYDIEVWYDRYSSHEEAPRFFSYLFYCFSELLLKQARFRPFRFAGKIIESFFVKNDSYKEIRFLDSNQFSLSSEKDFILFQIPSRIIPHKTQIYIDNRFFFDFARNEKTSWVFPYTCYTWNISGHKASLPLQGNAYYQNIFRSLIYSTVSSKNTLFNFNAGNSYYIYYLLKDNYSAFKARLNQDSILTYCEKSFTFKEILETDWSCFEK